MDLGIRGRRTIVGSASKGLGRACALALAKEGVSVAIVARTESELKKTSEDIERETGVVIVAVPADLATAEGRARVLAAFPDPDTLVNNAGGPPTGDFRDFDRGAWIKALDACMLGPIERVRQTLDGMIARRFGRIVNVTSYSVKMPIDVLCLSNGARSGLTGFVAGLARKAKVAAIPALRMGAPEEFGDMCAFLCSARAGYYTGQNVLLDGGLYPGTF